MARYRFVAYYAALSSSATTFFDWKNIPNIAAAFSFRGTHSPLTKPLRKLQKRCTRHDTQSIFMSTTSKSESTSSVNYNAVYVAKEGGPGLKSASEMMGVKGNTRSLGAPPPRPPRGGTFVTDGGVTIEATVRALRYTHGEMNECHVEGSCEEYVSSFFQDGGKESGLLWGSDGAIERLVDLLDHRRGALLTSGYEFPGR